MAITNANEVLTEVASQFKGSDATSNADLLQVTVNEICRDFPIAVTRASLLLTAETQEYAIGAGSPWVLQTNNTTTTTTASVARIKSAIYFRDDETTGTTLEPTVPEELIEREPTYRYDTSGDPREVYTTVGDTGAMTFGLYPKPDTTSVNNTTTTLSYPRVDFEFHGKVTFTGTTTVPSAITNPMVLVFGTAAKVAQREGDHASASNFESLYLRELANLSKELSSRHIKRKSNMAALVRTPRVK